MGALRLTDVDPLSERAAGLWRGLERRARASYFLSFAFVERWLAALPEPRRPRLHALWRGNELLALFFLGARRVTRHLVLPSRARYLNTTGDARFDQLTLEHNGLLCEPGAQIGLSEWLEVLPGPWDELFLPALASDGFPGRALTEAITGGRVLVERTVDSPFVDLARVRAAPGGYVSLLGKNARAQVRRSERGYGSVRLELASCPQHALDILTELVDLHERHWRAQGDPGAFADPWFLEFHRQLIRLRFSHGEIQLVRVRSASATVGCLYNFVWQGRVLFYQSGLATSGDPRLKPGYLCHARAVEHNAASGHDVYDFLGGDARYKRSLATGSSSLIWARIQKPLVRFAVERRLRRFRGAVRAHTS